MDKPWLENYPDGVPENIDLTQYSSVVDILESSCERFADQVAFINAGVEMRFSELDDKSRAFAAWLQSRGLKRGDRVALMMPNILQYPVALFGVLRAGLVVVNTNPMYTARELKHQLNDAGARAIVVVDNFAHVLESVKDEVPVEHVITTGIGDLMGFPKGLLVNFVVKRVKKMVPDYSLPGAVRFSDALSEGARQAFTPADVGFDDLAFLQYTGGTTGVAKGAMLTHRNIVANMLQSKEWLLSAGLKEFEEMVVTALPLYHIFALTANCLLFIAMGGRNLLVTNPRDMPDFVKILSQHPFTYITGVNTLFNGLLNTPGFAELDFSTLKGALGGGMAVQRAVAERWQSVTGKPLIEAYGLTETSPAACINPTDLEEFNGCIGLPISSTEAAVMDSDGCLKDVGEVGELVIRGPQVMKGYWQRPEETAKVLTEDGWLKTGDMAVQCDGGFFKIVDRKKDMILVSGFNVYPNEIEDVVAMHPGVLEVAAIGVPDEHSGEIVKICVVRKDPNLTAEDLTAFCKEHLTGYKRPKIVEFYDELPKSNVGKILRRELRDAAA